MHILAAKNIQMLVKPGTQPRAPQQLSSRAHAGGALWSAALRGMQRAIFRPRSLGGAASDSEAALPDLNSLAGLNLTRNSLTRSHWQA